MFFLKRAILGLIFCVSLLLFIIQIPQLKKVIIEKTLEYALNEPKHKIKVTDPIGFFPFSVKVEKCSFEDTYGSWLELGDIKISLNLIPFGIDLFSVESLNLKRIPDFDNTIDISLPQILPLIIKQTVIRSLEIKQILIDSQILGRAYEASLKLQPNFRRGQDLELSSSTNGNVSTTFSSQIHALHNGISVHFKGNEIPSGIFSAFLKEKDLIPEGNIEIEGNIETTSLRMDTDAKLSFLFSHSEWGKIQIQADQQEKIAKARIELSLIKQKPYTLEAIVDNKKEDSFLITFFKIFQEGSLNIQGDAAIFPKILFTSDEFNINANLSIFSNQEISAKPLITLSSAAQINLKEKSIQCKGAINDLDAPVWLIEKIGKKLEWAFKSNFEKVNTLQLENITITSDKNHRLEGGIEISGTQLNGKITSSLSNPSPQDIKKELILLETTVSGHMLMPVLSTKVMSPAYVPLHIEEILLEGNFEAKDLWVINLDLKSRENRIKTKVQYRTSSKAGDINLIADLKDIKLWHDTDAPIHLEATLDHTLSGKITGLIKDIKLGSAYFSQADLLMTLNQGKGDYHLKAAGRKRLKHNKSPHQIMVSQGQVDITNRILVVNTFSFTPENHKLALKNPCIIDFKVGKLDSFSLGLDEGRMIIEKLQWQTSSSTSPWKGRVSLEKIPFSLIQMFDNESSLHGDLSGHIDINGNQPFPILTGEVKVSSLSYSSFTEQQVKGLEAINADASFDWRMETLKWQIECRGGSALIFSSNGKVNLQDGHIYPTNEIQSTIKGALFLGIFSAFLNNGDRINGILTTDLKIHGTIGNPDLRGTLAINRGVYELSDYGTLIHDINLTAEAKGSELVITSLGANDGNYSHSGAGKLTGKGKIRLTSWTKPYIDIGLDLEDFKIAQSDSFVGKASGPLFLRGEGVGAKITGNITLTSASLFLEEAASPEIPTISITNLNPPTQGEPTNQAGPTTLMFPIELKLNAPGHFNIIGFGLESTWKGNMTVVGSLLNTELIGMITVEKGKLDVFGKTLKLTKGRITYDSTVKNDPLLFIRAVREADSSTTVTLVIEGRSSNPRFTFMSIPAYPEEEILSRLLFGKALGNISVGQSLQLASAAAAVNGQKGINVIDKIRSSFGLDTLELKDSKKSDSYDTSGGQALSIGKDFSNLRISIDQGVSTGTSKATLEAGIGHNLNVDIDIGGDQNSGVGLNWVKRY